MRTNFKTFFYLSVAFILAFFYSDFSFAQSLEFGDKKRQKKIPSFYSSKRPKNPIKKKLPFKDPRLLKIESATEEASKKTGLPIRLIEALIKQESGGGILGIYAVSSKRAKGLTQLMAVTAKEMGVTEPFDIKQNIMGGAGYLKKQVHQFKSLFLGLVAYNWGPNNTRLVLQGKKKIPLSVFAYAKTIIDAYQLQPQLVRR